MQCTGTKAVEGLKIDDVVKITNKLREHNKLPSFDVTEFNPTDFGG